MNCQLAFNFRYNAEINQSAKQHLLNQLNDSVSDQYSPKRLKCKNAYLTQEIFGGRKFWRTIQVKAINKEKFGE